MFYPLRKTWKKRSRDSSGKISRKYVHVSTSNDRSRRLSRLFRRYTCTVSHKIAYLFDDNDLNGIDRRVSCHSYLLVDLKKRKENWSCLQNNERNRSLPPPGPTWERGCLVPRAVSAACVRLKRERHVGHSVQTTVENYFNILQVQAGSK